MELNQHAQGQAAGCPLRHAPWLHPVGSRLEMWAVIEVLRRAVLPIRVHTDHRPIIDGLARGEKWTLAVGIENVDLWQALWFQLHELGGLSRNLQVVWVKGHDPGSSPEASGNRYADTFAKAGAALH